MAAAPVSVPMSPASSKRSRSRDSTHSAASTLLNASASTAASNTTALTIADPPYPAFLRLGKADIDRKWDELEWAQLQRLKDATPHPSRSDLDQQQQDLQQLQQDEEQQQLDQPPLSKWARCNGDEYASRNRYLNVDPYQANRVRLDVPDGCFDYINASPIALTTTKSNTTLTYIATQGPKADSWSHIWRMIWNQNLSPAVIVMLTQTHETGREKCYQYYPSSPSTPHMDINEHDEFGDGLKHSLELVSLSTNEEARTIVRELDLVQAAPEEESRKVWHLLFAGWPDFLVPEGPDRDALLNLIDMSREKAVDSATNPRIVHCSAGIGRSGTFIALDWLLQELDEGSLDEIPDDQDPVVNIIQVLRDQRPMMVQSKNQFIFIYDVIRQRWRQRWIDLHPDQASQIEPVDTEPALKRQKSMQYSEQESQERAQLEAELQQAQFTFENGNP